MYIENKELLDKERLDTMSKDVLNDIRTDLYMELDFYEETVRAGEKLTEIREFYLHSINKVWDLTAKKLIRDLMRGRMF